jgi:hypothetical protein
MNEAGARGDIGGGISATIASVFIPVGDLMRQLVVALGAAMVVGSIAVVVRERRRGDGDLRPKPNWRIVALNLVVGVVLTLWGVSSIMAAG